MSDTNTSITESASSKLIRIKEGDLDLQLHYNDFGSGSETIVMLYGSGGDPVPLVGDRDMRSRSV